MTASFWIFSKTLEIVRSLLDKVACDFFLIRFSAAIPKSPVFFPEYKLGIFTTTWAAIYMVGVPIGSYISAKILKEFIWKVAPARELLTVLAGSFMMGFGAVTGGGCNIGQALTGFSTLSVGSIVASIFIVFGNWTMVYFKFIKPMNEM